VSRDGTTLLVSDGGYYRCSHAIHELSEADGSPLRVVGSRGDATAHTDGPLRFYHPHQVYIAPDGFVFVADAGNSRVQVLTPSLDFHGFIGQGQLSGPIGVCANADVVVVSTSFDAHRISVWCRGDGALLRRFASHGSGNIQLKVPDGLCFMSGDRHVAVADAGNNRVSVFSVNGEFIRHVGVGVLSCPAGVVASAFDELVVTDSGNRCLRVFSSAGDLLATVGDGHFTGVVLHDNTVFATGYFSSTVSVLK
jgi:DNA-binding beta-propeller fold protein YncE